MVDDDVSIEEIAGQFELSSRQLRRIVQKELGVSPIELIQTRRLLLAKQLLTETKLPITEIAFASGFSSLRRFNDAFNTRYRMAPTRLRKDATEHEDEIDSTGTSILRLTYRSPYDWEGLLAFLSARMLKGAEWITKDAYYRTVRLGKHKGWIAVKHAPERCALLVEFTHSLTPVLPALLGRLRHLFDLSARPEVIAMHLMQDRILKKMVAKNPGLRVPGSFDGLELSVRAILGQQVTVKAATTLACRFVEAFGEKIETPFPELNRLAPLPERIASMSVDDIAKLGIISTRAKSIIALAQTYVSGNLQLHAGANPDKTLEQLITIPGIGQWTAHYIAMRALRWPDGSQKKILLFAIIWAGSLQNRLRKCHKNGDLGVVMLFFIFGKIRNGRMDYHSRNLKPLSNLLRSMGHFATEPGTFGSQFGPIKIDGIRGPKMSSIIQANPLGVIPHVSFHTVDVDGVKIFYREAGEATAPILLLLHGLPSSSHMFRELMPRLASKYRVIAPDFPGFGFTSVPEERHYRYSFDALAHTIAAFTEKLGLTKYAIYVFDYGAPVGFRLALSYPDRISAIISQNGNAYEEGLGDFWAPIQRYWQESSTENRDALRKFLTADATYWQYTNGVSNPEAVAPESYTLDAALLARPGNIDIQLDLFLDYASNLPLYPAFQAYFRKMHPPMLVIWGKNDAIFIPPGAEAFRRDNPNAVIQLLDTGHFALETHVDEIALAIDRLLRSFI